MSKEGNVSNEIIAEGQSDPKVAEAYRTIYFKPPNFQNKF